MAFWALAVPARPGAGLVQFLGWTLSCGWLRYGDAHHFRIRRRLPDLRGTFTPQGRFIVGVCSVDWLIRPLWRSVNSILPRQEFAATHRPQAEWRCTSRK